MLQLAHDILDEGRTVYSTNQLVYKCTSTVTKITSTSKKFPNFNQPSNYICLMYQSIPSLTTPPGDPRGFARSNCPGGRVYAQLSLPGGQGFELEEFSTVLKDKCRINFSICFEETGSSLKSRCSCINFCINSRCLLYL